MDKKLKVGVFGARRGRGIAQGLTLTENAYISAVCDYDESTYENIKPFCCEETKYYKDFDEFINSGLELDEWEAKYPDWDKVVLVPVTVTLDSNGSVVKIIHDISISSMRLRGGTKYQIPIQIVTSKFNDQ